VRGDEVARMSEPAKGSLIRILSVVYEA
jgi:hypothetical protein